MDGQSIYSTNTITPSKNEPGCYYVQGQEWQASARKPRLPSLRAGGQRAALRRARSRRHRSATPGQHLVPQTSRSSVRAGRSHASHSRPSPSTHTRATPPQQQQVGARYTLVKVLGTGSFSCVCLAIDNETQEQVRARVRVRRVLCVCRRRLCDDGRRRRRPTADDDGSTLTRNVPHTPHHTPNTLRRSRSSASATCSPAPRTPSACCVRCERGGGVCACWRVCVGGAWATRSRGA